MTAISKQFQSWSLALLLLLMSLAIFVSTFWEDGYIRDMRQSASSMYNDRLTPATDLFYLSDHLYSKRWLLEKYMLGVHETGEADIHYRLGQHDAGIKLLIEDIDKTYLVDAESKSLSQLKLKLADYNRLEKKLLANREAYAGTYEPELDAAFAALRVELLALTKIQQTVGKELSQDSVHSAASANSLNHLQLGIVVILGLLSMALALASRALNLRRSGHPGPVSLH